MLAFLQLLGRFVANLFRPRRRLALSRPALPIDDALFDVLIPSLRIESAPGCRRIYSRITKLVCLFNAMCAVASGARLGMS
jgi:hypothetical protein